MFGNLGFGELLLIFAVALVAFGPRRLPELARTLGRTLAHFRRAAADLQNSVEREVAADEIKRSVSDVRAIATLAGPPGSGGTGPGKKPTGGARQAPFPTPEVTTAAATDQTASSEGAAPPSTTTTAASQAAASSPPPTADEGSSP